MAPKMKMRPKAKAKGKAKSAPKRRVRHIGKALIRPAAAVQGVLKRPAKRGAAQDPGVKVLELWDRGEEVNVSEMQVHELLKDPLVVAENAVYYHKNCKVAGKILRVNLGSPHDFLTLEVTGTTSDSLLQHLSADQGSTCRAHICDENCNGEEVADDLLHIQKIRRLKVSGDEGWTKNLEKVLPLAPEDELRQLRMREAERRGAHQGTTVEVPGEKEEDKTEKEEKTSKKEKRKKTEKEKEKKKKSRKESSEDEDEPKLMGYKPKGASQKTSLALYAGTGLDPREKVRSRVAKRARRCMKKKATKDATSSSGSKSGTNSSGEEDTPESTLFGEASKVRLLANNYPGALTCQAIFQMKTTLIQEAGLEDQGEKLTPVALSYFRQNLQRKAGGAVARELQTLSAVLDALIKSRPSHAADIVTQRIKSIEQSLNGSHWQVSQRLEVLAQENASLTAHPEATAAQREVYQETKMKLASMGSDGRQPRGTGGGQPKGRNDNKGQGKQGGKDKKKGKGKGKNDPAKEKEADG